MITAFYSFKAMGGIGGMEPWLLFWLVCLLLYFVIFSIFKFNRSEAGLKNLLVGMLIVEVVFDLVWAVILYFNRPFIQYGVGITYGLFMWAAALLVSGAAVTVKNKRQN